MEVVDIPTNVPVARDDKQDAVYKTRKAKINAVVEDINNRNNDGQPILLGTVSVESSEELSKALTNKVIKHSVLNAWKVKKGKFNFTKTIILKKYNLFFQN